MPLLTTAMNPLSQCTTPRRLMAPISRHFLPVLQPEPPAWLTTGLMNGSRLPFAAYLLSGTTPSLPASPLSLLPGAAFALALSFTGSSCWGAAAAGSPGTLSPTNTAPPRLQWCRFLASAECACTEGAEETFFVAAAAGFFAAWVALAADGTLS